MSTNKEESNPKVNKKQFQKAKSIFDDETILKRAQITDEAKINCPQSFKVKNPFGGQFYEEEQFESKISNEESTLIDSNEFDFNDTELEDTTFGKDKVMLPSMMVQQSLMNNGSRKGSDNGCESPSAGKYLFKKSTHGLPKSLTLQNRLKEVNYSPKMGMRTLESYKKKKKGKKKSNLAKQRWREAYAKLLSL